MKNIAKYIIVFILTCIISGIIKNEILLNDVCNLFSQNEINNFRITNYLSIGIETIISLGILFLVFASTYFLLLFFAVNYTQSEGNILKKYAKAVELFFYSVILGEISKVVVCIFSNTEFVSLYAENPDIHSYESAIFEHTQYMISVFFVFLGLSLFTYKIYKLFKEIPILNLLLPLLFMWVYFGVVHFSGIKKFLS